MAWWIRPLEFGLRILKQVRGSTSVEHGLVAGTAVVVAATMASGLGSTNVDTANESKEQVQQAVAFAQTNLVGTGGINLSAVTTDGLTQISVAKGNTAETVLVGATARVINTATFFVSNPGNTPYNISNLLITYQDATQVTDLFDPSVADAGVNEAGTIVTAGRVTFNFVSGTALPARTTDQTGQEDATPTIGPGGLVEVVVDLTGLTNRLSSNTSFSLELEPAAGIPFLLERTTPDELSDQSNLD